MTATDKKSLTRREFLKLSSAGLASAVLIGRLAHVAQAEAGEALEPCGILIDLTRCTGCSSCALACRKCNQLDEANECPEHLSSSAYTFVESCSHSEINGEADIQYVKRQCMHCLEPACVSACTVGALQKTAEGPVVYQAEKCIGCRYCQYACPFGIPRYDWEDALGLIHKCQLCVTRLQAGQQPACVAACSSGALRFDRREALLAQAHGQIASNPTRYIDHVYGEHEAGGTSVLYLSGIPFGELGFPNLSDESIPHVAETVMQQTPAVALTVASVATSLYWLTRRRRHLEHDE